MVEQGEYGRDHDEDDSTGRLDRPDADECRTEDTYPCTVSDARTIIRNIIARYGDGKPMLVRFSDECGEMPSWSGTDQVLARLDGLAPEDTP